MVIVEKCPKCQQLHPEGQLDCTPELTEIKVIKEAAFSIAGAPARYPVSDSLLNEILDSRYRIIRVLGSGGMGKVYAAEHLITGKRYAIKVLNPNLADDEEARRRFAREAKAISAIEHPHIVELYDYGQTAHGVPFLAMEYMEGTTLRAFLAAAPAGGLPVGQAVSIALQMAQALQHVHERGIVHRDVKPDNIQIEVDSSKNVVAKLFDFGIARIQSQEAVTSAAAGPPRTLAYGAPEMYERHDYLSPAIDVYALGVTMFEILTKQRPFGGTGMALLLAHLKETPGSVAELRKDVRIPAELDALISRMLAKEPEVERVTV
jgi:serine/threonine protein kinase